MKKEFNLSERIFNGRCFSGYNVAISVEDVKEFIKRLKEEVYEAHLCGVDCSFEEDVQDVIDKLAGDKLVENKK